jgi:hypothetical protein
MVSLIPNHFSGAKAQDFLGLPCGTAEAVPFQNNHLLDFNVHATVLNLKIRYG